MTPDEEILVAESCPRRRFPSTWSLGRDVAPRCYRCHRRQRRNRPPHLPMRRAVPVTDLRAQFESRSHWFTESSLEESLRPGECLVCSNLDRSKRHSIHSFLWEGMMSPHARTAFLNGRGFCARHFWIAKRIEDECWPAGGIGVAILCENLIDQAVANLPTQESLSQPDSHGLFWRKRETRLRPPGSECIFCRERREREESLLDALQFLKQRPGWTQNLERSPLCVCHSLLALRIWKDPADRKQLRSALVGHLRELQAELGEFIRKHDWNCRDEPLGPEKDSVFRAIQILTGLQRQFPFQRIGAEGDRSNGTRKR